MAKLTFITGEMGCGKTAHLIQSVADAKKDGKNVVVMKSATDTKNGRKLLSRNGLECDVDYLLVSDDDLYELAAETYANADEIFIDEAQFLQSGQIDQALKITALLNIDVVAYGLRLNFNIGDENFAGATRLSQIAHEVKIIDSKCDICGKNQAVFSVLFADNRVVGNAPTILISDGTREVNAKAVCAKCYYESL